MQGSKPGPPTSTTIMRPIGTIRASVSSAIRTLHRGSNQLERRILLNRNRRLPGNTQRGLCAGCPAILVDAYDPVHDTVGAIDPNFFVFKPYTAPLKATLPLQLSSNTAEINEFGWFETNANGTLLAPKQLSLTDPESREQERPTSRM